MKTQGGRKLKDGASCKVIGGTHAGKSGIVRDIKTGKNRARFDYGGAGGRVR